MDTENLNAMQTAWTQLLTYFRVPSASIRPAFEFLREAYGSPDRHYHNLDHLDEMFRIAGQLMAITDDSRAVQLAIWFHDAVYDPRARDNETRSAELAVMLLGPIGVPRSELDRVTRLILATGYCAEPQPPPDRETAILLDADLAIFGAPEERYDQYAATIREEYEWVPEADYREVRSRILEQILARPRIYWIDSMHKECTTAAQENIRRELAQLRRESPSP
ncbi:MAG TPA: hypothetical protein VGL71_09485 [Urbifossiella sp.]|jgi:predicted metal-dependent HD superfamily phosphohydrolase